MLKFILFLIFMPLVLINKKFYWILQNLLFISTFLFLLIMLPSFYSSSLMNFIYLDFLSFNLILLSLWICCMMVMASEKINYYNNYKALFTFFILLLMLLLMLSFCVSSLLMFYLFFESSLIPTLFLILGWGYQPERIQAGLYLLFYTLCASLPLLMGIFFIYEILGTSSYSLMINLVFNNKMLSKIFFLIMIIGFLVKMPMFLVHLWLPKAHVEAPISGSMILAGILLKLGGYGLLRVIFFLTFLNTTFNFYLISISLYGGVLISLNCLRQIDFKSLIAYSSIAHMGLVLSGLFTMSFWGINSAYSLMLAHGLCSSGLFCLANLVYERMSSRSLLINKGLLNLMPSVSLWWFLLCASNMAAPPTLNLLSEIGLLNSILSWSWISLILLTFLSFFSAAYCFYLFSYSQHGSFYSNIYSYSNSDIREYLLMILHWLPLNLVILKSSLVFIWL